MKNIKTYEGFISKDNLDKNYKKINNDYIKPNVKSDNNFDVTTDYLTNKEDIEKWLTKMKITNFTINDDLTVDVNSFVDISHKDLNIIPVQFNNVSGAFNCAYNNLTSLKGCPKTCLRFHCNDNKLKTLEYIPDEIITTLSIYSNNFTDITDLKPTYIINKNLHYQNPVMKSSGGGHTLLMYINKNVLYNYFDYWLEKYPQLYKMIDKVGFANIEKDTLKDKYSYLTNSQNFDLL